MRPTVNDALTQLDHRTILLADRRMGLVIRVSDGELGVQVPGEEEIRWLTRAHIFDVGGGALIEGTPVTPTT